MSFSGKVDFKKIILTLKEIPKNLPQYKQAVLKESQSILRDAIRSNAPKKTGKYGKSWKIGKITGDKAVVFTDQGKLYAILEFTGAKSGTRTPKKAKAIRFELPDGTIVFTMKVNFPGFDNIPHVRPVLRKFLDNCTPVLFSHLDKISPLLADVAKDNKSKINNVKSKLKIK